MRQGKTILLSVLLAGNLISADTTLASPWIDPGQAQLRHHIQVLVDAGLIHTPVTTWPLPWAAINAGLDAAGGSNQSDAVRWSLAYVRFYLERAQSRFNLQARAGTRPDPASFREFGSRQREENELSGEADWMGEQLAARLRLTWAPDASDEREYRLDGSYMAAVLGNWSVSLGAQDRWWGPGWQSSLILSSNARPVPAISLQRQSATAFETPWLSWLGPWTFTAFAGQLESGRAVPEARLWGARFALKPFSPLEIGFSHTGLQGGETSPDPFVLQNLQQDELPDKVMAAIDLRWGFSLADFQSALYYQYAGDGDNGFPSRGYDLAGVETAFTTVNLFHRVALEYTDTAANACEFREYPSGYRFHGRTLGSSFDSDSRVISLLADHYLSNENQISWRVAKMELDRAGSLSSGWGGSPYQAPNSLIWAEISYAFTIKNFKISTAVYTADEDYFWHNQKIGGTGFTLATEYRLE